ncbi:GNAT family N-acetyltransferase [Roseibium sp. HPY-6]|uniref:GNAT family N-acetyltransferase n=1 Tax=Roseibium sp. HPY-6 TaxID=3229852 RepID=UPI00338D3E6C
MAEQHRIFISKINAARVNGLRSFLRASWWETYQAELGQDLTKRLVETLASEDIGGLLPCNGETAFVAEHQDSVCGCCMSASRKNVTYLWGLYVLRDFQKMGLGQRLLRDAILEHDRANSAQLTVLKSSTEAVQFYKAMCFKTQCETQFEILPGLLLPAIQMSARAYEITRK